MYKLLYILPLHGVAATVTISYPTRRLRLLLPSIPPYSVSEFPNPSFFLDLVAGFEPEGESPIATSAREAR